MSEQINRIVADDGFFFGVGAFETIAVEQGVPLFLLEHIDRMMAALDYLGIGATREELVRLVRSACEGDARTGREALKLTVTKENRLATMRENGYDSARISEGFQCAFSDVRKNETSPLVAMKTLNYGDNILLKRAFAAQGIDEPLFLNSKGQVAEGATSNVFAVFGDEVATPPVSCGLLPGIMRDFAMSVVNATERVIVPEELLAADEVFLTNSLMGAMPVRSIGCSVFLERTISRLVNDAYQETVSLACASWKGAGDPWGQLFEN